MGGTTANPGESVDYEAAALTNSRVPMTAAAKRSVIGRASRSTAAAPARRGRRARRPAPPAGVPERARRHEQPVGVPVVGPGGAATARGGGRRRTPSPPTAGRGRAARRRRWAGSGTPTTWRPISLPSSGSASKTSAPTVPGQRPAAADGRRPAAGGRRVGRGATRGGGVAGDGHGRLLGREESPERSRWIPLSSLTCWNRGACAGSSAPAGGRRPDRVERARRRVQRPGVVGGAGPRPLRRRGGRHQPDGVAALRGAPRPHPRARAGRRLAGHDRPPRVPARPAPARPQHRRSPTRRRSSTSRPRPTRARSSSPPRTTNC